MEMENIVVFPSWFKKWTNLVFFGFLKTEPASGGRGKPRTPAHLCDQFFPQMHSVTICSDPLATGILFHNTYSLYNNTPWAWFTKYTMFNTDVSEKWIVSLMHLYSWCRSSLSSVVLNHYSSSSIFCSYFATVLARTDSSWLSFLRIAHKSSIF